MYVPDHGMVTVHDRGGAIKNAHIDIWFDKVSDARQWGAPQKDVEICN
jgi:3D (Asp-Asp-Asp) domain-containing protein